MDVVHSVFSLENLTIQRNRKTQRGANGNHLNRLVPLFVVVTEVAD